METGTTQENWTHGMRKKVDACIKEVGEVKNLPNSKGKRELSLVYTKLQEAKMWLGKVLEEMGSELPKEFQDKAE